MQGKRFRVLGFHAFLDGGFVQPGEVGEYVRPGNDRGESGVVLRMADGKLRSFQPYALTPA